MERETFKCPGCGHENVMNLHEFVDVTTDPEYKEKIMNGDFFLVKCPECGDETLAEYPMMYMDPEHKLTVYMAPGHDESLLEQLNSLDVPEGDLDDEAVFRVVSNSAELLEKILMADGNRDDRVMELYKAIVAENIREEFPQVQTQNLLYFIDGDEEYFIVWDYDNPEGEQLTIDVDEELYSQLKQDYLPVLSTPSNKYAEVNGQWLAEKINVEP